jgi:hypothetical protein
MTGQLDLLDWMQRRNAVFDGNTFDPEHDQSRLRRQLLFVFKLMRDGAWRTLREISELSGYDTQSISARLRDLRKEKFGGHAVERQRRGAPKDGIFEYRLLVRE